MTEEAAVVSAKRAFTFGEPCSGRMVADALAAILLNAGRRVSRRDKIIGHLKAVAVSGEHYLQMSLTSLPAVGAKADPEWYGREYRQLELTVNLIVFGFGEEHLQKILAQSLEGTIFSSPEATVPDFGKPPPGIPCP